MYLKLLDISIIDNRSDSSRLKERFLKLQCVLSNMPKKAPDGYYSLCEAAEML